MASSFAPRRGRASVAFASRAELLARRVSSTTDSTPFSGRFLACDAVSRFAYALERNAGCQMRDLSSSRGFSGPLAPGDDRELVGQGGELRPRPTAARWRHARTPRRPGALLGSHEEEPLRLLCAALVGLARGGSSRTPDESAPSSVARPLSLVCPRAARATIVRGSAARGWSASRAACARPRGAPGACRRGLATPGRG